jgi:hypothetical protein
LRYHGSVSFNTPVEELDSLLSINATLLPWSSFKKGGMLDNPPLKKGDLGGLSVTADKELSPSTGKEIL